jgi:hypothetical protein
LSGASFARPTVPLRGSGTGGGVDVTWKRGITREVFLVGRWAFKVPSFRSWSLFLTGLLCNLQERTFSRLGDPRLCPVRFSLPGGWLVVMPRCEPVSTADAVDAYASLSCPGPSGASLGAIVEDKTCSFGRLPDGRVVAVDYG